MRKGGVGGIYPFVFICEKIPFCYLYFLASLKCDTEDVTPLGWEEGRGSPDIVDGGGRGLLRDGESVKNIPVYKEYQ